MTKITVDVQTRRRRLLATGAAWAAAAAWPAHSAGYPERPVTLIVPFPPGGQNDLTGRVVAQTLTSYWSQPVVVDNRSGALGIIGAQAAARAAPDGHTLFLAAINHTILASLKSNMPYDLVKDFRPVCLVAIYPIILVANPTLPAASVRDLIAYAKVRPGEVTFGAGPGGSTHLAGELFASQTGTKLLHVPYKGSAPAMTDLLGGQINLMFSDAPTALPHIRSGRLRALGISTRQRSSLMPDLATIAETVPGYESSSWSGVLAPAGTPAAVVAKVNADIVRAVSEPAVRARLLDMGGEPAAGTPEQFRQLILDDIAKWAAIGRQAGIRLD